MYCTFLKKLPPEDPHQISRSYASSVVVGLVSLLTHKFVRLPHWCYLWKEIKKYNGGVAFLASLSYKVYENLSLQELLWADRQT
jgi:hypothetical protein